MPAYDDSHVFAKILRGELPAHKIHEDEHTLTIMDIMPRADGHCLVLPKEPARNILDVSPEALSAVHRQVQRIAKASMQAFAADGMTIQQFNEGAGGQVVFHLHVHVIPRYDGVALRPHTGEMADNAVLAASAEKLRAALASS